VDPAGLLPPLVDESKAATSEIAFSDATRMPDAPLVKPPIYMDYGLRVDIDSTTFINRGCTILDTPVGRIKIGKHCNIGPNVSIYAVDHSRGLDDKGKRYSTGHDVTIGDYVWIGGGTIIM